MAKNRKTVLKGFTYLQCDDFAAYLSQMAANGWHFKEWGVGLVFEKGAPEKVEYAVEVFTKGSQYDLRPEIHTLDFADYCQAAGWELVDSKQKFCIFKKVRPDAVPILTPEERLQSASKVQHHQVIGMLLISLIWIVPTILRFIPVDQLLNSLFSNVVLIASSFMVFFFIYALGRYIGFWFWNAKAKRFCRDGKTVILQNPGERIWSCAMIIAVVLYTICYGASTGLWALVIFLGVMLAYLLLGIFLSKARPDAETHQIIQILFAIILCFGIVLSNILLITAKNEKQSDWTKFPLHYEHLAVDAGKVTSAYDFEDTSIWGSERSYHIFYENASIAYEIYESKHNWVLDIVWDYHLSRNLNVNKTDCTADWRAEAAYHNELITYYVRYDDAILVLHVFDDLLPSQQQIDAIRTLLELG